MIEQIKKVTKKMELVSLPELPEKKYEVEKVKVGTKPVARKKLQSYVDNLYVVAKEKERKEREEKERKEREERERKEKEERE